MNYLDLFSGIGGFTLGLQHAGFEFDWHGYSEIDPYAESIYQKQFPDAHKIGDISNVNTKALPKIELITLGWPCQDVSIAGRRGGLQAARSGLFFEAIKILRTVRPNYFIAENVKGLFSSNNGADFTIVLQEITNIGYDCQWQLLNTRWVLPQNRERIYFVGHLRERPRPEIFPLTESTLWTPSSQEAAQRTGSRIRSEDSKDIASSILKRYGGDGCDTIVDIGDACDGYGASGRIQDQEGDCSTLLKAMGTGGNNVPLIQEGQIGEHDNMGQRVYSTEGISTTLRSQGGGQGAKTGLYSVPRAFTEARTDEAKKIRRETKDKDFSPRRGKELVLRDDEFSNTITSGQSKEHWIAIGSNTKKGFEEAEEGDSIDLKFASSKTRRGRVGKGVAKTLDHDTQQGVVDGMSVRRLTPMECERLQGFPDGWTEGLSDTRRYQALGNAVSVPIVAAVAKKLKGEIDENRTTEGK
jgi:DNA (cytosine-5)-methyltransferase 1